MKRVDYETAVRNQKAGHDAAVAHLIERQDKRVTELLAANNALVERARKAEQERDGYLAALLSAAHLGGVLAQEIAGRP